ncbi:hypothetical protein AB836_00980 [Rickettsiales bacterium (ex Bugula neritina AB1)]|nr:hypothetical protein AB836_00980 [Rickettsiales bacterium (ex Bugula neritina AB1)]
MFKIMLDKKFFIPLKLEINIHKYFSIKLKFLKDYINLKDCYKSICEIFYNDVLEIVAYYSSYKQDNKYTYIEFIALKPEIINDHLSKKLINDKEYEFLNEYIHPVSHNIIEKNNKNISIHDIISFNLIQK